jgi:hypothetical protein
MATATVFVDDAVRGALPAVCVKDGIPTADRLTVRELVGDGARLGVAWLLVLAGPPGWIALLAISFVRGGRGEELVAQVPMGRAAYGRLVAARRDRLFAVLGTVAAVVVSLVLSSTLDSNLVLLFLASLVVGLIAVGLTSHRVNRAAVALGLDASRRWVTIYDVHPAFAVACAEADRNGDRQRP